MPDVSYDFYQDMDTDTRIKIESLWRVPYRENMTSFEQISHAEQIYQWIKNPVPALPSQDEAAS